MKKLLPLTCVCLLVGGCLAPPPIPPGVLSRYQQAVLKRSPDDRLGEGGLGLLQPAAGGLAPDLDVRYVRDPQTHEITQRIVHLSIDEAIRRALSNNLDIAVVSFDPSVSREQMIQAAAAFDAAMFAGWTYTTDDEQTTSIFGGGRQDTTEYTAGLTAKTITGATWAASWTLTRTWDNSTFTTLPARFEPVVLLEMTQPLLRDAWPQFNLATLRLARVNHRISMAKFRQQVEAVITETIVAYWHLWRARREVEVQKALLDETLDTLRRVRARAQLDATAVQITQAETAVANREARLIQAEQIVSEDEYWLGRLLGDEQINPVTNCRIVPTTVPVTEPVRIDTSDQLMAAVQHNPLLEQARDGIAAADIQVEVARNQALPRLDLTASSSFQGLDSSANEAHENAGTLDFISYSVGIRLEYPLGNRELRSRLRQARLRRRQAVTDLQNAADRIASEVRTRIRRVEAAYRNVRASREASRAAKEQLRALKDIEELRGRLTPEFLQVKLTAQELIATAEIAMAEAVLSYNQAMVELAQHTGTVLELNRVKLALPVATGQADWPASDNTSALLDRR